MNIKYNFALGTIDEIIEWYGKYENYDIRIVATYDTSLYNLNLPIIIYDSGYKKVDARDRIKDKQIQIVSVDLSNDSYISVSVFVSKSKESLYTEYNFELKSYETFSSMYNDISNRFSPFAHLFCRHIIRIYLDGKFAVIDNIKFTDIPLFDRVFDQGVKIISIKYFNSNRYSNNDHVLAVTISAKRSEKAIPISIYDHLCKKYKIFSGGLYEG